ncbi:uncharacterized protein PHACADRAFT_193550 [Phanerochaete carnosa HHB-10118-sp]|uniref:Uncharacterized protein n=1 Tax=Phanerochaete carnosa (strain HHB-10118-sp) TaxID=650164 RepID=K5X6F4_PHACS|nr:uncharacterized protein PHACADRAFT_193550 [Phanerochaete carnosa HHB-10118-sp]EKM58432.1 hypothetical protein PHACADRAFT_193550 [Phanerochaete carnosa HHB-10118-sp]
MYFAISLVLALAAMTAVSMPPPKGRREDGIARRSFTGRSFSRGFKARDDPQPVLNPFTSGAVLNATAGTITGVTESFVIPNLSVPEGQDPTVAYTIVIELGMDWYNCPTGGILAGIQSVIDNGTVTNSAFFQAFPESASIVVFPDFSASVGDSITTSVTATNATSTTVIFVNQSTNQTVSQVVTTGTLCLQEADWLLEDLQTDGGAGSGIPFADFGVINITGVSAQTPSGPVGLAGATIFEMELNNTALTSVLVSNSTIDITYL